ncbi:MAG: hypothetical protein ACJ708_11915 [Nitrososphaeraceae archaeon]
MDHETHRNLVLENSGEISMMGLFMVTAGLATYGIATFGTKLHLQSKIKAMKAKAKELMLAHNNQIIS